MAGENEFLLYALLMGAFITFVYDLLRIFRRVVSHGSFLVSLEDLAFWIYCGAEVFLMMYHEGNGSLRWFAVIGAMCGMYLYKKLVSEWFVKYAALILNKILWAAARAVRWLCAPFGFAGRKAWGLCRRAGGRTHRLSRRVKRGIKNRLTFFWRVLKMNFKTH